MKTKNIKRHGDALRCLWEIRKQLIKLEKMRLFGITTEFQGPLEKWAKYCNEFINDESNYKQEEAV